MERKYVRGSSSTSSSRVSSGSGRQSTIGGVLSVRSFEISSKKGGDLQPQYNPETETLKVQEAFQNQKNFPFYSIWRYATKLDIFLLVLGTICAVCCAALLPFLIHVVGHTIGNGLDDDRCSKFNQSKKHFKVLLNPAYINEFVRQSYLLAGIMTFLCYGFATCFSFAAENQMSKLRIAYFESIVRKDMSWLDNYIEREFGGQMTHDITRIRAGIGEKLAYFIYIVAVILCLVSTAIYTAWEIAIPLLCLVPILGIITYLSSFAEVKEIELEEKSYAASDVTAEEILSNIKTVKVYSGESKALARYKFNLQPASTMWKWIFISGIATTSVWFIVYSSYGAVFFFGSDYVIQGFRNETECLEMSNQKLGDFDHPVGPESLFVIFYCVIFAALHMGEISFLIDEIKQSKHIASEVFFRIDWIPRIDNLSKHGEIPSRTAIGKIELDGVSFRYPRRPDTSVLYNIRMTIHPGQVIAFVGEPGSGKSTLLRLIQRLYDPTGGSIILDGRNIESLNVSWLRSQMGILTQEPVLFNRTIEENVRFSKLSSTLLEVQDACRKAGIHDDILQFKDGYQTVLNHRGDMLSDVQKRQLSFARVYLQRPKILILDDPVGPTDIDFGETILKTIMHFRESTTILISSSEVNAIVEQSDKIYVLEKGAILERGHHGDLMLKNGIYARIKNQTFISSSADRKPKFISQLTSYRFAQSLRRMHLRKSLETAESHQNSQLAEISDITFQSNSDTNIHAMFTRKSLKMRNVGMRISGGLQLQLYHYARSTTDPRQLKRIFDKGILKIQHEKGFHMARSAVDKSISLILKDLRNRPPTAPVVAHTLLPPPEHGIIQNDEIKMRKDSRQVSIVNQSVRFVLPSSSTIIHSDMFENELPLPKTMEADNRSVASKDSEAFWDAYMDVLSDLEGLHKMTSWKDLFKISVRELKYTISSILASAVMGLYYPMFAVIFGNAFGSLTNAQNKDDDLIIRNNYCFYFLILGVCATITALAQETILGIGGFRMTMEMRLSIFTHILKQRMAWFDLPENDINFLCARLSSDTASIENLLMVTCGVIVQSLSTTVATLVIVYCTPHFDEVVNITVGMAFVILVVIYVDGLLQLQWEDIIDNVLKDSTALEIEVVSNIRTIIILGLEEYFLNEFLKALKRKRTKILLLNQGRAILFSLSLGLPYLCYTVMLSMYAWQLIENRERVGRFHHIIKLGELLIFGIVQVGVGLSLIPDSKASRGAAYRINRIFNSAGGRRKSTTKFEQRTYDTPPEVEVKDLVFIYAAKRDSSVLKSLTFTVKSAGFVALVGPSGSGKSTVINLILRLYEPTSGFIKFDGENTNLIDINCTRSITSLIEQNPTIFDLTIRENIAYGDNSREVLQIEIIQAAQQAEVHDQIMLLEKAYETPISSLDYGHRSFALRQRIVIARAILRNPKLLLIDEATASSDFENDLLLLRALDQCHLDRTTIVASQRIEPIRNADLILVMNNGEFIESGTDQQLLLQKGLYFNMYMGQRVVEGYQDNPETFARERLHSLGGSNESINTRRRRRRSSIAYNNYLQKRLTNYIPKPRMDSSSDLFIDDDKDDNYGNDHTSSADHFGHRSLDEI